MIAEYVEQSNLRFGDALDAKEECRRLWIAHKLILWAQAAIEGVDAESGVYPTYSSLASSGVSAQSLSKSVGGVSVSKSEGSGVSSINGYGELKLTIYGLQLIALLKTIALPGRYVR